MLFFYTSKYYMNQNSIALLPNPLSSNPLSLVIGIDLTMIIQWSWLGDDSKPPETLTISVKVGVAHARFEN